MKNNNTIKINELQEKLGKVYSCGYGDTIELKYNGELIASNDILNFSMVANLEKLKSDLIELKINGEYYTILK